MSSCHPPPMDSDSAAQTELSETKDEVLGASSATLTLGLLQGCPSSDHNSHWVVLISGNGLFSLAASSLKGVSLHLAQAVPIKSRDVGCAHARLVAHVRRESRCIQDMH
jgi:hypothetical protein